MRILKSSTMRESKSQLQIIYPNKMAGQKIVCGLRNKVHDCDLVTDRFWGSCVWFELGRWGKRNDCEPTPNVIILIESDFWKGNHTRSYIQSPSTDKSYSSNSCNNWKVMTALINCYSSNQAVKIYRVIREGHIKKEHGFGKCFVNAKKVECTRMYRKSRSMPKSTTRLREWDWMTDKIDRSISSNKLNQRSRSIDLISRIIWSMRFSQIAM
jgi:hypothetical protein